MEDRINSWMYEVTGVTPGEDAYAPNLKSIPRAWLEEVPDWFDELEQYSITVDQDGRAAGLIANWDACYLNIKDTCWTIPEIKDNEEYVYQGNAFTLEGDRMPVSILAATKGHNVEGSFMQNTLANQGFLDDNYQPLETSHDIMAHQLMYGRFKNTPQGIAFLGAVFPHVSTDMVNRINASAVSGHWESDPGDNQYHFLGGVFVNRGALPLRDKSNLQLRKIAASMGYNHIMAQEKSTCACKDTIAAATDPNVQNATGQAEAPMKEVTVGELVDVIDEILTRIETLETEVIKLMKEADRKDEAEGVRIDG